MDKILTALKDFFKKKNIVVDDAELAEELAGIVKEDDGELDTANPAVVTEGKASLENATAQNEALQSQLKILQDTINKEMLERERVIKLTAERAKAEHDKKILDVLKKAKEAGKIAEADVARWKEKLEKDFDWANSDLENLEVKKEFRKDNNEGTSGTASPEKKDYNTLLSDTKNLLKETFNENKGV